MSATVIILVLRDRASPEQLPTKIMIMFHQKIALSVLAFLPASVLCAQIDPPTATSHRAVDQPGVVEGDAVLANWLLVGSNNEVAVARLVQGKAVSNDVKQFAKRIVDEHGKLALELQPFAGTPVKPFRDVGATEHSPAKSGGTRQPADADVARPAGAFDHLALIRDLGEKCLASETKMLDEKTGAEFDLCYMRMQVAAHVRALDMCEVFGTYASKGLRATLEKGQVTLQAHLEQAKALCTQLEKGQKVAKSGSDNR